MSKKAILVVSFGTSYEETRKRTIDAIEDDLAAAFPERTLYRAWTSRQILKKLKETKGIHYDTIEEAMERMLRDGITDLLVQPTHMLYGLETKAMTEEIGRYQDQFESVRAGKPLLAGQEDKLRLTKAVADIFSDLKDGEILALMGHGSPHVRDSIYEELGELFRKNGHNNILVGTVEHEPGFGFILERAVQKKPERVILAPLMIVAGDHALNDMSGEDEDSWKSQLENRGISTSCVLKGIGEYAQIRRMLVKHAQEAVQ